MVKYTEQKAEAFVRFDKGEKPRAVAEALGIGESTAYKWQKEYAAADGHNAVEAVTKKLLGKGGVKGATAEADRIVKISNEESLEGLRDEIDRLTTTLENVVNDQKGLSEEVGDIWEELDSEDYEEEEAPTKFRDANEVDEDDEETLERGDTLDLGEIGSNNDDEVKKLLLIGAGLLVAVKMLSNRPTETVNAEETW